ncbi:MAG: helix-hairpin-helix domain-containing protein [Deltaproteobacteria bacterium]|nr:helix-hairpin-helix domain-containing protein [Deltaproteobacteria bacterium]
MIFILLLGHATKILLEKPSDDIVIYERPSYVQVEGAVRFPGVYPVDPNNTTLESILRKAGGLNDRKREHGGVQQNSVIRPGTKVTILSVRNSTQLIVGRMDAYYRVSLGIPLSVNSATESDLIAVPGIGPRIAEAIVRERTKRGKYNGLEEILEAKGINLRTYRRIAPYLTL